MIGLSLVPSLILTILTGVSIGMLGGGGSIVTLPVLVYIARIPVQQAVGMSLAVVGATAALGGYVRLRRGEFTFRPAALFTSTGMAGAFVGSKLTHLLASSVLMLIFGTLMMIVGTVMIRRRQEDLETQTCRPVRCLAIGTAVGILTGFLGVSGGFLIIPALVLFAGVEMKKAMGTSMTISAFNSVAGLLGHLRYTPIDWGITLAFLAAAVTGMFAGLAFANRFSSESLRRGFSWFVIVLGLVLAAKNLL